MLDVFHASTDGTGFTAIGCHTEGGDTDPSLTITYSCSPGSTSAAALSRVVVYNRLSCCQDRITDFQLDFVSANGEIEGSYLFDAVADNYTIQPPAAGASKSRTPPMCGPG